MRIVLLCGLLGTAAYYLLCLLPSGGWTAGLSLRARGSATNATGQIVALYAISNGSPRAVYVQPGIELSYNPRLYDLRGTDIQLLQPGSEMVFPFDALPPARPVVHCQHDMFTGGLAGFAKRLYTVAVRMQSESEIIYASP